MVAHDQESALAELIDAAATSPLAAAILEETARYLGVGIGNLINLFNPERVILGGWAGLLLGGQFLPVIRESARQHSMHHPFAATSIELGRLGPGRSRSARDPPMESFLNGSGLSRANTAEPADRLRVSRCRPGIPRASTRTGWHARCRTSGCTARSPPRSASGCRCA